MVVLRSSDKARVSLPQLFSGGTRVGRSSDGEGSDVDEAREVFAATSPQDKSLTPSRNTIPASPRIDGALGSSAVPDQGRAAESR
jgi:hypothetical protein